MNTQSTVLILPENDGRKTTTLGLCEIQLTRGQVALVSPEDYAWLAPFKWWALKGSRTFYAYRSETYPDKSRKFFYMHRQILGFPEGMVDHWDGDGLHNWRGNLREATRSQNSANAGPQLRNTLGFRGVFCYGNQTRYRAMIMIDRKIIHLGCRDTKEEAARLYDAAALHHFGQFARLNFPAQEAL